jgi:hypothetical protein
LFRTKQCERLTIHCVQTINNDLKKKKKEEEEEEEEGGSRRKGKRFIRIRFLF